MRVDCVGEGCEFNGQITGILEMLRARRLMCAFEDGEHVGIRRGDVGGGEDRA